MNKHIQTINIVTLATILTANVHTIEAQEKRNVLFLMADDFNYWTGKDGYYPLAQTPNLDRLAEKGILFSDAHCTSPVCNPSRNSLWSGYRPSTTGITHNAAGYVRDKQGFADIVSMNQVFTENGYFTHGAGKLWHPGSMGGKHTDPETWISLDESGSGCHGGNIYRFGLKSKSNYVWSANPDEMTEENCADFHLAMNTARLIENYHQSEHRDQPFFIACGVFRPHMPWNAPLSFWNDFNRDDITKPRGYNGEAGNEIHQEIVEHDKWEEAIHAYLASCKLADSNIGIMLDALENSPHKDNTIIVFLGDHGWHLGEKGHWGKFSTWNEANQTTLIIYDPAAKGNGRVCSKVVSLQDLYPTLAELTGVPLLTEIEGRSLAPLIENPERSDWDWPVLMTFNNTDYIKTNNYRFVDEGDKSGLYDMTSDPYEWNNLYGLPDYEKMVRSLRLQIDSMKSIGLEIRDKRRAKADNNAPSAKAIEHKPLITNQDITDNTLTLDLTHTNPMVKLDIINADGELIISDYLPGELKLEYTPVVVLDKGTYKAIFNDGSIIQTELFYVASPALTMHLNKNNHPRSSIRDWQNLVK